MDYQTAQIAERLKKARHEKGLSQRALSERVGIPQSQISKIENGAVDMRLSTLVELARTLELELILVPRKTLPAVQSVVRSSAPRRVSVDPSVVKELKRVRENANRFAAQFAKLNEFARLQNELRDIERMRAQILDSAPLRELNQSLKKLKAFQENDEAMKALRKTAEQAAAFRNQLAHSAAAFENVLPKSAYSLEEGDDG
ncbi:MAG: helix-turn-helix domain-containing protein [Gammaproteobacteria bacterium]